MKPIFIINPNAGKGSLRKSITRKLGNLGIEYYLTENANHATEIAAKYAESEGEVVIFSCGGEGTNYEVVNGIAGCDNVTLGIVPLGTGNDFIKYFGERTPFLDIEDQLSGEAVYLDLIKVESEGKTYYGINSCSAGMDAMVCENTVKFKKLPLITGSMAYLFGIVQTLFCSFSKKMDFVIDSSPMNDIPSLFAVCANAPFYGGGYKCAPDSNPSDGKLNYSIISTRSKLKIVSILGKYRKGTHTSLPFCHYGECSKMEYRSSEKIPFNIDGEVFHFKDVKCEVVKHALKLMLPKSICEKFRGVLTFVKESQTV